MSCVSITLQEISDRNVLLVGDRFRIINDVLGVFKQPLAGIGGPINPVWFFGDKKYIWFPKIAVETKEKHLAPPDADPWRNTLSFDQKELLERFTGDGEFIEKNARFDDPEVERAIFAKFPKEDGYKFLGVFKRLKEKDIYGSRVYQQVAVYLPINEWITAKEGN